ncbi:MAG: hypothetical protein JO307_11310 [Bryobacterales bacterium]|nr:hypothetical protein [Bryobacterales bacterium]MBV9400771.1 hypothetical protein [Bryobacterales bacterium]
MNRWLFPIAAGLVFSAFAMAQGSAPAKKPSTPPRAPDGHPDLQGIYSTATLTPLERPGDLGAKQFFTEKEAVEYENQLLKTTNRDRRDGGADTDVGRAYNEFWFSRGDHLVASRRTSLIVDPPDGKMPALTPAAQKAQAERTASTREHAFDGPEYRNLAERCLLWATAGPPMLPGGYNNNYQIVQTPDYVMILVEMIHDVRIIPLDGRPHLPSSVRLWLGDSRGHWEGDTLVVDTTNFSNKTNFRGADENLHLIERFTRTGPDTVVYQFTVEDPSAFTRPWSAEIPMNRVSGPIIEYACNEGNYGMEGILSGARAQEKK